MEPDVALVTGSTRGLGAAIAARLAADGAAVAVNGLDPVEADAVVARIRAAGGTAVPALGDVTDPDQVAALAAEVRRALGPVRTLVLNATGPQPDIAVEHTSWRDHLDQLDFFARSPVLLLDALLDDLTASGGGRIVMVDSEVVDRPPPGRSAYATAKSAQVGLMRAWAVELAGRGITVNAVAPGFVPVERHDGVDVTGYLATVPVARMGTPDDVANAVAFFAARAASFVTGQRLTVDGGRSLA
ncbi:SDR family NAD(P)-dependent oxidoreductase [Pimelobacter simplex]|uniref:SDR family NAD(P)-dependent oxidoreductase n=1 Tax=Nocardioides simplex TaxID=2045 RepID=UPI003AAE5437